MDFIRKFGKVARPLAAVATVGVMALALTACGSNAAPGDSDAPDGSSALVSPPVVISDGSLVVCANFDSPPNIFIDEETGDYAGVEYEIALEIAERLGVEARFEAMSWGGMLAALQARQCDTIISTLYVSEEREEIVDFVPYLQSASGILVSTENPKDIGGYDETLCGHRLLTISGTDPQYTDVIQELCEEKGLPLMDLSHASSSATALQQVSSGQVDAFMESVALGAYYVHLSDGQFKLAGEAANPNQIGAATLKDNSELHDAMQATFDEMIADGTYDEILGNWGQEPLSIELWNATT